MKFSFEPGKAQLRVFSAVCSNLVAGWLLAMFASKDPIILTGNILFAIISRKLAVSTEEILEEL